MADISKRERILNAAEALFAQHGYDGVSIRQISSEAKVDVALASYHFGKKLALFHAVFDRRADALNNARLEALRQAQADADIDADTDADTYKTGPGVEQIIEAFLRPLEIAMQSEDDGWKNYLALVAYINNSPFWGTRMMSKIFDSLVDEFIDALRRALPNASEEDLYWCYHNLSGALTLTLAQTGRIDILSGGVCRSSDVKSAYDRLIPFAAAGFHKVCG